MKDWRSIVILVLVSLLLGRESAHTEDRPGMTSVTTAPLDLRVAIPVRIVDPVPVMLVTPVDPSPNPTPDPFPAPVPGDTALSQAGRSYLQTIPTNLPGVWDDLANRIERGEINDKLGAVKYHNQVAAGLNTALDQVFSSGIDASGKIVNRTVIINTLRQSAAALRK